MIVYYMFHVPLYYVPCFLYPAHCPPYDLERAGQPANRLRTATFRRSGKAHGWCISSYIQYNVFKVDSTVYCTERVFFLHLVNPHFRGV